MNEKVVELKSRRHYKSRIKLISLLKYNQGNLMLTFLTQAVALVTVLKMAVEGFD